MPEKRTEAKVLGHAVPDRRGIFNPTRTHCAINPRVWQKTKTGGSRLWNAVTTVKMSWFPLFRAIGLAQKFVCFFP